MATAQTVTITRWTAQDGSTFDTEGEAVEHDEMLGNLKYYRLWHGVDLTETGYLRAQVLLLVNAKSQHQLFAEWAATTIVGRPVDFVQGVMGSNSIVRTWRLSEVEDPKSHKPSDAHLVVQDRFVKPAPFLMGLSWGDAADQELQNLVAMKTGKYSTPRERYYLYKD